MSHLVAAGPLLLTIKETAQLLGVSRTTLDKLINDDQLRVVRIGRSVRVPRHALEQFLADLETEQS